MSAAKKPPKAQKPAAVTKAAVANVIALAKQLDQLDKETAERQAKREAETAALRDRSEHPTKYIGDADIIEVSQRMSDIVLSLLAMRMIGDMAADAEDSETAGNYSSVIKEMARANIKGLDACIGRLMGGQQFGSFSTEFDGA